MELHQIQVTYRAEEDRILCRASFKAEDKGLQEIRAWLTRRMVKALWPATVKAMERQVALDKPQAAHASGDVVEMEHHTSVDAIRESGNFSNPYEDNVTGFPLGDAPILVTTVNFTLDPGQPIRMNLAPSNGCGFEIAFAQPVLHGFCSLLRGAVKTADWGIDLGLPGTETISPGSRMLN